MFTCATVVLVFVALVRHIAPPDAVFVAASVVLGVAGIVSPAEVFSGFVNPGVLTIVALFIVAAAVRETGALDTIGTIVDLECIPGLIPLSDQSHEARAAERRDKILCEVVISNTSPLLGKNIREGDVRAT